MSLQLRMANPPQLQSFRLAEGLLGFVQLIQVFAFATEIEIGHGENKNALFYLPLNPIKLRCTLLRRPSGSASAQLARFQCDKLVQVRNYAESMTFCKLVTVKG